MWARAVVYSDIDGWRAVFRLLSPVPPLLEQLGLPGEIEEVAAMPDGLVMVAGPTGAGKSTTMACLAQLILTTRAVHVVSLEHPVEMRIDAPADGRQVYGIASQRELPDDRDERRALMRSVARSDLDVLLLSEVHGSDDAKQALTMALSGHLVIVGIHASDTASACERMRTFASDDPRFGDRLAQALRCCISQRLIPAAKPATGRHVVCEVASAERLPRLRSALTDNSIDLRAYLVQQSVHLDRSLARRVVDGEITQASADLAAVSREEVSQQVRAIRDERRRSAADGR